MRNRAVLAVLILIALAGIAFGQATDGNIVGTVTDASGATIPNATVTITNAATGTKSTATTNSVGEYRFNNVLVGTYDVSATAGGFTAATLKSVRVELNKTATVNVGLQVGQVKETVSVSEAATTIDTTTAQVQATYESKQIVDLPIIESSNGLFGALQLSLLGAGVASNGGVGQGTGPSVGGQRPMNNNFTIEGVDNNNKTVTGPLVYVPTEATQEFTLLQNQFSAEFGHSTGGQFSTIVKGGTNEVHGSLYEYFQNRNLNAIDQQYQRQGYTKNPRYDQNRMGGSIGGPIKKNKLFYFADFEYAPLGQASSPGAPIFTPTAAGYSLLDAQAAAGKISKTNYDIFKQYVTPAPAASDTTTVNGTKIPIGILPLAAPNFTNFYSAVGSVDYNPSDHDQIRGRFIYNKQTTIDNLGNLPAFWTNLPQKFYLASFSEYHTFTPSVTNEFRLAYNRFSQFYTVPDFKFPGLDVFPNIQMDNDLGLQLGPDPNAPQSAVQNTYQLVENINWTKGKHTLKFGFDGRRSVSPQHFIQRERGDYDYSTLELYLKDQVPDDLAERNLGGANYWGNQWATYLFGNDSWRIRPNLTLNLGVRWERTTVPATMGLQSLNAISSVPGLIDMHSPRTYNKGWAPRIGVAYSPGTSGRTSIRAGFGMAYDVIFDNVGSTAYPPQLSATFDADNYPKLFTDGNFLAKGGIYPGSIAAGGSLTQAQARSATSSYLFDQIPPYSIQWNLSFQHVFKENYTFETRYLGSRGVHLLTQIQINRGPAPVQPYNSLPVYLSAPTPAQLDALTNNLAALQAIPRFDTRYLNAGFGANITAWPPSGDSTYHGLATQLTRRFSKGFQMQGAYTWSHNIDDCTATHFSTLLTPRRTQDFGNLSNDRSTSALDRRQRLTLSWLWEMPWYSKSQNKFAKNVIGGWRVVGTYTAESGELATVQSSTDANLNGDSAGDRAVLNPAGNANVGSGVTALKNSAGQTVGYLAQNPNARYINAAAGVFPNAGRNTLQMPGINNFDASLGKTFSITEHKRFELRGDLSNLFNHPQYTSGYINSVRLTSQISNKTFLIPSNTQFQNWAGNFPSNARGIQLAARFMF